MIVTSWEESSTGRGRFVCCSIGRVPFEECAPLYACRKSEQCAFRLAVFQHALDCSSHSTSCIGGATASVGSCGSWTVLINYSDPNGTGIGKGPANILTGVWFLTLPNGHNFSGTVLGGTVTWPSSLNTDIGCGDGVATASAGLSFSHGGTGSFGGCLDDTHPLQIFPPHIWGTISKS